ncbi:Flp family type IVb pilin [Pusillimonas sp. 7-48]|uniref:Flp family type IVb pilin n=2 Tax=Pusillimonas minor TaxID=2697024 RepID=A0A842HJG9_9BURK|nr:Flp family type IVb pilin [Pusillimonas minor]
MLMLNFLKALRRDERGVSALEYAILGAVVLAAISLAVSGLDTDIAAAFTGIGDAINPD